MGSGSVVDGTVIEAIPNALFIVALDDGRKVTGHISQEMKMTYIRLVPGNRVRLELSPYDLSRGRITRRHS